MFPIFNNENEKHFFNSFNFLDDSKKNWNEELQKEVFT